MIGWIDEQFIGPHDHVFEPIRLDLDVGWHCVRCGYFTSALGDVA